MAENFPNLGGEMNTQVYEEKRSPNIFNLKSHRDTFMWNLFKKITPKNNVIMEKTSQMVEWWLPEVSVEGMGRYRSKDTKLWVSS